MFEILSDPKLNFNMIMQGDALELLRRVPDDSVDMTFADPPFNLHKRYSDYRDGLAEGEYLAWSGLWLEELVRVTKSTGSIFVHNIPKWLVTYAGILDTMADFKHWITWDAPTAPMCRSLQPNHYGILYYAKDADGPNKFYEIRYPHKRCRKCRYLLKDYGGKKASLHPFGPLVGDVWTDIHRVKHNKYRDNHPCQLPVHLLERIILMSTDEGDVVLDPFMGTGTTAIAAKRLGRRFVGFELAPEYVKITRGKLAQEDEETKIGRSWVSLRGKQVMTIRDIDWPDISQYYAVPESKTEIDHYEIELGW